MAQGSLPGAATLTLADVDYPLPDERIAQVPIEPRDSARLLSVNRDGTLTDLHFYDLPELLRPGDLLVANETRVRQARLRFRLSQGGSAEMLVLAPATDGWFACLVRPGRRLAEGSHHRIGEGLEAEVGAAASGHPGARLVRFEAADGDIDAAIERCGEPPLPPYIHERLLDRSRYQTIYSAGRPESAAAPTAGLHFTDAVRARLEARGIGWATLRLEVGLGTFTPIRVDDVQRHVMHHERFELPAATVADIERTRAAGGRIIAVGTTSVRVLESCVDADGRLTARAGETELYITPGHRFRAIDGMLTNFHQPRSSLIVMVAALLGLERWRAVYSHALAHDYRFLSFGDCMIAWVD